MSVDRQADTDTMIPYFWRDCFDGFSPHGLEITGAMFSYFGPCTMPDMTQFGIFQAIWVQGRIGAATRERCFICTLST